MRTLSQIRLHSSNACLNTNRSKMVTSTCKCSTLLVFVGNYIAQLPICLSHQKTQTQIVEQESEHENGPSMHKSQTLQNERKLLTSTSIRLVSSSILRMSSIVSPYHWSIQQHTSRWNLVKTLRSAFIIIFSTLVCSPHHLNWQVTSL